MKLDSSETSNSKYSYTLFKEFICPSCGCTIDDEYDDETVEKPFEYDDCDYDENY